LVSERNIIRPKMILAMGATAAAALTGTGKDITKRRGSVEHTKDGIPVFLTVHPSYLLRLPDPKTRAAETDRFRSDLEAVALFLSEANS
ncbi:hypothetical protein LCGC14_2523170, partial [marine sediment metagenome]